MIVDLTEIEGSSLPFEVTITPTELRLEEEAGLRFVKDVSVTGEVQRHSAEIDVKGHIAAPVEIDCSRCLNPVAQDLAIDFRVSYVTPENFAVDKEREVLADDLDTDVLDSDRLDMNEVVREQILLNLPEQVFCRPDCKGICPGCGVDRNLTDCECDLEGTDPRWAALKDLRS
jgi:uncharacterized protein